MRPLGIPNGRDYVVHTAVVLILEPIFEADFLDCSHGFAAPAAMQDALRDLLREGTCAPRIRPGRSAHDALEIIRQNLGAGRCTADDADMEGYFDSIPHDKLMACVRMRVVDGSVLRLIAQWLNAPVEERDENGRPRRKRNEEVTPQRGGRWPPPPALPFRAKRHAFAGPL